MSFFREVMLGRRTCDPTQDRDLAHSDLQYRW